ncbi:hypothetical protein [Sporanaerobacter sp. PP17-6a]|uniref:hypothetical protein n=1 Tax=Sporanaerobacter sp. PP17-6a TaxID=1891289 RepID=UPI0008A07399|nr:hypothetical protein [Sporanaerobacter sp. PP17-6a]SCL88052.1 hypothetical protein PP176A_1453 [Sporanaerobacter sp. PP17-6a]
MEKSFCFNSVDGDRKYKAEDFRDYFASFVANGVFPSPSDGLQAIANSSGMSIIIKQGKGWINGAIYVNTDDLILNIDAADGTLNRIDRIVLRMDTVDRAITAQVKKGTAASMPTAPELQRDADGYEIALADVTVGKGITAIIQANITDLRLNTGLCGIVHGIIDQVDTTTIFNQYVSWYQHTTAEAEDDVEVIKQQLQQSFDEWFATVQDTLDGDTAGNLLNLINAIPKVLFGATEPALISAGDYWLKELT